MSKTSFEIQQNIKNLREQINDLFHLSYLNHQSYLCINFNHKQSPFTQINPNLPTNIDTQLKSNQFSINQLKQRHQIIQNKLKDISTLFQKRTENHLNYLITKQIQGEEQCVRRDRLSEYEEKIYDQRRLISDKQVFCESLLRPKKQRPQHITSQEFQQMRLNQKVEEQKNKLASLEEQIKNLISFKKRICESEVKNGRKVSDDVIAKKQKEMYGKLKSDDLQKTKAHSLQTVNLSIINNINTEKPQKAFEDEDFNGVLAANGQDQSSKTKKQIIPNGQNSISQKTLKYNTSAGYSIQIQKLIQNYEKTGVADESKQRFGGIVEILQKIKQKKEQNSKKCKEWKQLEMQNAHMRGHLKKTRQLYLSNQNNLSKILKNVVY